MKILSAALALSLFSTSAYAWAAHLSNINRLNDYQYYTAGKFGGAPVPIYKSSYVVGADFTDSIDYYTAQWPNNVLISWKWPEVPANGVWGFNDINFYNYYGNEVANPIAPKQVSSIVNLQVNANITLSGETTKFNVIEDLVYNSSSGGTVIGELEVMLHCSTSALSFIQTQNYLGQFTDVSSGKLYDVYATTSGNPDYFFLPHDHADYLNSTVNIKAMLAWLVTATKLTGNEWVGGMALGAEPIQGYGSILVNTFSGTFS